MSYLGAKVFLNKKSVTSEFLSNYGVSYKTTNQINYKELNSSLTIEEIENNKAFYYSFFSKNAVENKIIMMLEVLEKS